MENYENGLHFENGLHSTKFTCAHEMKQTVVKDIYQLSCHSPHYFPRNLPFKHFPTKRFDLPKVSPVSSFKQIR